MINSNLRCKDNTFSDNMNTFTKKIQKKIQNMYKNSTIIRFYNLLKNTVN